MCSKVCYVGGDQNNIESIHHYKTALSFQAAATYLPGTSNRIFATAPSTPDRFLCTSIPRCARFPSPNPDQNSLSLRCTEERTEIPAGPPPSRSAGRFSPMIGGSPRWSERVPRDWKREDARSHAWRWAE